MELSLSDLRDGESGVIISIGTSRGRGRYRRRKGPVEADTGGERGWGFRKRLEDMGLTPGTKVTVLRSAPFNGPLEVYVRGSRLAIGRGMAERVFVEVKR